MSHYFDSPEEREFERESFTVTVWGRTLRLTSGAGVFSRGHLDAGTAVLLRSATPSASAREVLDLGCGYGVIGLGLDAVTGARVTAVDTNRRALDLAGENAVANDLHLRTLFPDEADPTDRYDEIWSNPPIRIGKPALHDLLLTWLPRLTPAGRLVMVVGRNLGADSLQRWLVEQGWPTARLASAKGFRVLETRRA